jgi:uncharacterized membrane protein HdeD (DUF308 family)
MDSKIISRIWWALALRGILAILFGLVALIFTRTTLLALVYVFGIFAILSGLSAIVAAVRAGEAHYRWGWLAFAGVVGVVIGILSFIWPGLTALAFVYIVAIWAIASGVAEIAFALQWPVTLAHPGFVVFSGALSVIFGLLLVTWPKSGAIALTWLIGIYAILYGTVMTYYAYRLQAPRHQALA